MSRSHETNSNREKVLVILTNSVGDRDQAENMLRLLEWQAYSDGFIAGMNGRETTQEGEGRDAETP